MGVFADLLQNVGEAGRRLAPGLAAMGSNASTVGRNIAVADQQYRQFEAEDKQRQMADALAGLDDYSYSTLADTLMQYDPKLALAYKGKAYEQQKADELRRATVGNILGFMQKEGIDTSNFSLNSDPEILKAVLNSHIDAKTAQQKKEADAKAKRDFWDYKIKHPYPTQGKVASQPKPPSASMLKLIERQKDLADAAATEEAVKRRYRELYPGVDPASNPRTSELPQQANPTEQIKEAYKQLVRQGVPKDVARQKIKEMLNGSAR